MVAKTKQPDEEIIIKYIEEKHGIKYWKKEIYNLYIYIILIVYINKSSCDLKGGEGFTFIL